MPVIRSIKKKSKGTKQPVRQSIHKDQKRIVAIVSITLILLVGISLLMLLGKQFIGKAIVLPADKGDITISSDLDTFNKNDIIELHVIAKYDTDKDANSFKYQVEYRKDFVEFKKDSESGFENTGMKKIYENDNEGLVEIWGIIGEGFPNNNLIDQNLDWHKLKNVIKEGDIYLGTLEFEVIADGKDEFDFIIDNVEIYEEIDGDNPVGINLMSNADDTYFVTLNLCEDVVCENGGSCISNTGACNCVGGYSGNLCEIPPAPDEVLLGDVHEDNKLDINDIITLADLVGKDFCVDNMDDDMCQKADINCDGAVNVNDLIKLADFVGKDMIPQCPIA